MSSIIDSPAMTSISQEAKIARRRAKNREAQRRHRASLFPPLLHPISFCTVLIKSYPGQATKAKLAEFEALKSKASAGEAVLPQSFRSPALIADAPAAGTETPSWEDSRGRSNSDAQNLEDAQHFHLLGSQWHLAISDARNPFDQKVPRTPLLGAHLPPESSTDLDLLDFDLALTTNVDRMTPDPRPAAQAAPSLGNSSSSTDAPDSATPHNWSLLQSYISPPAKSQPQGHSHSPCGSSLSSKSALHLAAASGNAECVRALLAYDADVNITDSAGRAPLHVCAAGGEHDGPCCGDTVAG